MTSSTVGYKSPKHGDNLTCSSNGLTPSRLEGDPRSYQRVKPQRSRHPLGWSPLDRRTSVSIALPPLMASQLPAGPVSPLWCHSRPCLSEMTTPTRPCKLASEGTPAGRRRLLRPLTATLTCCLHADGDRSRRGDVKRCLCGRQVSEPLLPDSVAQLTSLVQ